MYCASQMRFQNEWIFGFALVNRISIIDLTDEISFKNSRRQIIHRQIVCFSQWKVDSLEQNFATQMAGTTVSPSKEA